MHAADCECVVTDKKKISYRKHTSNKAQTHKFWWDWPHAQFYQTESNCCDILGSFYEEKAQNACCCLGRGKLMGTPLRKWGQLTKAELQFSTTTALVVLDPPSFSQGFESNLFQCSSSSIHFSCSPCVTRQVSAPAFCHLLSLRDR